MLSPTVAVVCVAALIGVASGYPFEVATKACQNMLPQGPGHNNAKPQKSKMPYGATLDRTTIRSGDSVKLTISQIAGGPPFAGMMVQARVDANGGPEGTFQPEGDNARTITCSSENDTGSHNSPDPKKSVTFIWTPPTNKKGPYQFYVTVAKTKTEYWAKQKVGAVTVK